MNGNENKEYRLKQNDIFKLGRIKFKVLRIQDSLSQMNYKDENAFDSFIMEHYKNNITKIDNRT